MTIQKISILLTFFIFVMVIQVKANELKSVKYTTHRDIIIKIDENTGAILKRVERPKNPIGSAKKSKAGFEPVRPFSSAEKPDSPKLSMSFLESLGKMENFPLRESLLKAISSCHSFQHVWIDRFLISRKMTGLKSSNSGFGQSISNPYPKGENHWEEGKILPTFKLLQMKREETFKEIFMGFSLSFDPTSTRMLVEMNISPSSEKGPGLIISF